MPKQKQCPLPVPRRDAIDQVRGHLDAPGSEAARTPILNFTGPAGFGKTALLRQLDERFGSLQEPPRALVDCAKYTDDSVRDLLREIKFQLGRRYPGYGRIPFRRLELALAVTKEPIDFDNQREAYRKIKRIERAMKSDLRKKAAAEAGGEVAVGLLEKMTDAATPLSVPFRWVASTAISYLLSRPLERRRFRMWFGHRDRGVPNDPMDDLAELNRWAQDPHNQYLVDLIMVDAFLADLRDAYGRGRLSRPGWLSCVVLLDNVDTPVGWTFLEYLVEFRGQNDKAGLRAEAATLVATSREAVSESAERHALPAFAEADVVWLSSNLPEQVDRKRLPKLIHLTTGYPAAAAALVDAACRCPKAATDIDTLLTAPSRDAPLGAGKPTVEERMCDDLVETLLSESGAAGSTPEGVEVYVTCSAARNRAEAEWLAQAHAGALVGPAELLRSGLWPVERATAAHDLLRWLLQRRLAARDGADPTWSQLHEELRNLNREQGDLVGELYHALANGELRTVAERLADRLADKTAESPGLDVLKAVTSAPRPGSKASPESPYEQQLELARFIEDPAKPAMAPVSRLVAGLWLAGSPTTGLDRHRLHRQIALDYWQIAPMSSRPAELVDESERHDRLAQEWQ